PMRSPPPSRPTPSRASTSEPSPPPPSSSAARRPSARSPPRCSRTWSMRRSRGARAEMEVGLLTAFLGGALALLSPCGALLLPGFFASTVSSRAALLPHAVVFYLGLVVMLVPLGIGAGALGALVIEHRS